MKYNNYTPRFNEVERGILVSPCPSVRLSVCGQNRVRSVSSTILIGSISYLHILSSNLRRCVAGIARFKSQNFVTCNFDFVFFWLWIQYDSMAWVIMRRRWVSSERRRSSCSSFNWRKCFGKLFCKKWVIISRPRCVNNKFWMIFL